MTSERPAHRVTTRMVESSSRYPARHGLLLLLGSSFFMLLLAEGLLRLYPPFRPVPRTYVGEYENRPHRYGHWVADPLIGWKLRPHLELDGVESNAQGFRSPRDLDPNQPCRRIAVAGDSFTFGAGIRYDKTFTSLTEASVPGSCVDNMGMPGFGLDQVWQTVRTQALPLHPRLVIVAFITEDFARSEEAYRTTEGFNKPTFNLVNGRLVPETARDRPNSFVRFLQHHSSLWRVTRLANRAIARYYPYGEWWSLNAAILDGIQDDCRRAGVPVLFVYIPTRQWQTFPSLRAYMASKRANFMDLSQGQFAVTPDMYLGDGHLNEKGDRQVANALLDWLNRNLRG